jgi:hypothetical protein
LAQAQLAAKELSIKQIEADLKAKELQAKSDLSSKEAQAKMELEKQRQQHEKDS